MPESLLSGAQIAADIAQRIAALPDAGPRRLIAISGPPGSGKSTLAEAVVTKLKANGHAAALMPMDGFHLDDRLLEERGLLARKGAPETFDFGGFLTALKRVRDEPSVVLPIFDRVREIAIAGAAEIRPETRFVVVEGNYLCLDEEPWRALATHWDLAVFLDVPANELERRLIDRWLAHGFDAATAKAKARDNDMTNAERVKHAISRIDMMVTPADRPGNRPD